VASLEAAAAGAESALGNGASLIRSKAALFERRAESSSGGGGGAAAAGSGLAVRTPANPYKRWMADKVNLSWSVAADDDDEDGSGGGGSAGPGSSPHSPHSGGQLAGLRARRSVANNYAAAPLGPRHSTPAPQKPAAVPVAGGAAAAAKGAAAALLSPTVSSLLTAGALRRQRNSAQAAAAAAQAAAVAASAAASAGAPLEQPAAAAAAVAALSDASESGTAMPGGTPERGSTRAEKLGDEKYQVHRKK